MYSVIFKVLKVTSLHYLKNDVLVLILRFDKIDNCYSEITTVISQKWGVRLSWFVASR